MIIINQLFALIEDKVNKPFLRLLNSFYTKLFNFPRPLGIPILMVVVGLLTTISVVLWCVIFSAFFRAPLAIFQAASVYEFTIYTITTWIDLYRLAWLASAAEYGYYHGIGPIPAYVLYFNTLKYSALYYPHMVVFNLLLVFYMVLFGHCFGVMLHGLIMQKPKIEFKINARSVGFRMLLLIIILIIFVWCPPVFGPGIPANFDTGDPLNPIDWSKTGCANPNPSEFSSRAFTQISLPMFLFNAGVSFNKLRHTLSKQSKGRHKNRVP
jgi:uncharacterized membrane protein